jgi:hypothetical protein
MEIAHPGTFLMSLFGKLLAIFNILAAIAFFCVGALD